MDDGPVSWFLKLAPALCGWKTGGGQSSCGTRPGMGGGWPWCLAVREEGPPMGRGPGPALLGVCAHIGVRRWPPDTGHGQHTRVQVGLSVAKRDKGPLLGKDCP